MASNRKRKAAVVRQALVVALVFAVLVYAGLSYSRFVNERGLLTANFVAADGKRSAEVKLELASTPSERSKGLMFRKEMERDRGMLLLFPDVREQQIWMKNTYISLDLVFVDERFSVVGIIEKVPTLNETIRKVSKASKLVIELNAGTCKELGIAVGSKLELSAPLPAAT